MTSLISITKIRALSIPRLALQDLRGLVVIDEIQRLSFAQREGFMKQA